MMKGAEEWSLRSMVVITFLMLGCIIMIVVIARLEAAQQPGPGDLQPFDAVLESTSVSRIGPVVLVTRDGPRLRLPRGLRGAALQNDLEIGQQYTFLVAPDCLQGARDSCELWGIEQHSRQVVSYPTIRSAWDRGQRIPYVLMLAFFSLAAVMTGGQVWLRLRGWQPTIPDASIPSPEAHEVDRAPLGEAAVQDWLGKAQAQIKRDDRRITIGAVVVAAALLLATRIDSPIWEESLSVVWFAVGCTVLFGALAIFDLAKQHWPTNWVKTKAYVHHVTVLRQDNGYIPAVLYEYAVGAQTRRGFRVHINGPRGRFTEAMQNANQYRAGTEINCYYDPARPGFAVLDRGRTWTTVKVCAAFCVGSWLFAYLMS